MQIGAYSGVLKMSRQMPPCMVRHLNTSEYQSRSLSDLQQVLILTGASVSKSSLVLTLNNAAQSLETILLEELQKLHTSMPTSCLLISMLNLARLNSPVELRRVSLQHLVFVMLRTFFFFFLNGLAQYIFKIKIPSGSVFLLQNTSAGVLRKIILIQPKFTSDFCFFSFDHALKKLALPYFCASHLEDDQLLSFY